MSANPKLMEAAAKLAEKNKDRTRQKIIQLKNNSINRTEQNL